MFLREQNNLPPLSYRERKQCCELIFIKITNTEKYRNVTPDTGSGGFHNFWTHLKAVDTTKCSDIDSVGWIFPSVSQAVLIPAVGLRNLADQNFHKKSDTFHSCSCDKSGNLAAPYRNLISPARKLFKVTSSLLRDQFHPESNDLLIC